MYACESKITLAITIFIAMLVAVTKGAVEVPQLVSCLRVERIVSAEMTGSASKRASLPEDRRILIGGRDQPTVVKMKRYSAIWTHIRPFYGPRVGWTLHVGCYLTVPKKEKPPQSVCFPLLFLFLPPGGFCYKPVIQQRKRCEQSPLRHASLSRGSLLLETHQRTSVPSRTSLLFSTEFFSRTVYEARLLHQNKVRRERKERRQTPCSRQ